MSKTDQRTTATKHNTIIALRYNIPELRIVLAQFETEPWKESLRDAHSILVVPVLKSLLGNPRFPSQRGLESFVWGIPQRPSSPSKALFSLIFIIGKRLNLVLLFSWG